PTHSASPHILMQSPISPTQSLWPLLVWLLLSCTPQEQERQASPTESRPNFLFIAIDDLNVYNAPLGELPMSFLQKVYPDSTLRAEVLDRLTPNLQRLADQALTFERTYCAAPLCGPSRTALLTGVPPHVSGYYQHDQHFRGYPSLTDVVTLPQYLRRNGYFTAGLGKVFHKSQSYLDRGVFSDWPDQIYSWDHWVETHIGVGPSPVAEASPQEQTSPYWPRGDKPARHFTRFGRSQLPREQSNDYYNAQFISQLILNGQAELIDRHGQTQRVSLPSEQPYFLACGLFAPHLPWVVPDEYWDLFPPAEMAIDRELLQWLEEDLRDLSPSGLRLAMHSPFVELREHAQTLDPEKGEIAAWRTVFQAYLATVAWSDRNLALLVDAIEQNPQKDNTVVILWSDHGYHLGDKSREGKVTLWEAANHCNLMMLDPREANQHAGKRSPALCSLQDLYPTIVSLAGLDRPRHVHGQDLSALLNDPQMDWPHSVLSTNGEGNHSLRTEQFRYLRYRNGDQELYDLKADPLEVHNLALDPAYAATLHQLEQALEQSLGKAAL
ncbi:MAG: sulfatase, partial [Bacteroidota bacterium]